MGAHHSHGGHGTGLDGQGAATTFPENPRARRILFGIVVPLFLLTVMGVIMLWPSNSAAVKPGDRSALSPGSYYTDVLVTGVDASACLAVRGADGATPPAAGDNPAATGVNQGSTAEQGASKNAATIAAASAAQPDCMVVTGKPDKVDPAGVDPVKVTVPPEFQRYGIKVGDTLKVMYSPLAPNDPAASDPASAAGTSTSQTGPSAKPAGFYGFVDYERGNVLWILAVVYALLVIAVAKFRGLAALVGLVFAFVVIGYFVLPSILAGNSALMVGVVGASLIMHLVLYTAHGLNLRTTTALIGTMAGVAVTALIGVWASTVGRLSGLAGSEDALTLQSLAGSIKIGDVVLCGLVLAGLGVLNDVTITQASAIWELNAARPDLNRRELFVSGMRIGRDHIASTVYTIAFAYAGSALPVLLLVTLFDNPLGYTLSTGEVAVELVRTLVGSIGLVLAIPATTILAAWAVRGREPVEIVEELAIVTASPVAPVTKTESKMSREPELTDMSAKFTSRRRGQEPKNFDANPFDDNDEM